MKFAVILALLLTTAVRAQTPYSWEGRKTDLSPVAIQPFVLPTEAEDAARRHRLQRMNIEEGVFTARTRGITKSDIRSRDLFILDVTQSLEGGFDSVNLYDRGVLSWGIMQWTARTGSLHETLKFIKRRLWAQKRKALWDKTFTANGIDIDRANLIVFGKPLTTAAQTRLAFRGTLKVGKFDSKLATHWATAMARAGRQPAVMGLQVEYASRIVDAVLEKRLKGLPYHAPGRAGVTVADLAGNDPYAEALVFALWTNNPRHAWGYVADAARAARSVSASDDPSLWKPGAFSDALLRRCANSKFGNWPQRAALIEARAQTVRSVSAGDLTPFEREYQTVLTARKAKRALELASRGKPPLTRLREGDSHRRRQGEGAAGQAATAAGTPKFSAYRPRKRAKSSSVSEGASGAAQNSSN